MLRSMLGLAAALSLTACGGSEDVCALALSHVEACTGLSVQPAPETCEPEQAQRVLDTDCAELAEAGSRQGFWNLQDLFSLFTWPSFGQGTGLSGCSISEFHDGYTVHYHCPSCSSPRWECSRTETVTGEGFPWIYGN